MPRSRQTKERLLEEFNRNVREINRSLTELEQKTPDSVALERYKGEFYEINDPDYNYNALRRLNKRAKEVLKSGAVSIEGQERSMSLALETLHREGYDYINRRNFNSFVRFLDDARARGLGAIMSSGQMVEMYNKMRSKGLTKKQITANLNRWSKSVRHDKDGKVIEQVKPRKLYIKV